MGAGGVARDVVGVVVWQETHCREHSMEQEEGIGLADAERIVELNLSQITEKLLQTCTLSSTKSDTCSDTPADEAPANTHHNYRYNKFVRDLFHSSP